MTPFRAAPVVFRARRERKQGESPRGGGPQGPPCTAAAARHQPPQFPVCRSGSDEIALLVLELAQQDHDEVDQRPEAEQPQGQEVQDSGADLADHEPVDSEEAHEETHDCQRGLAVRACRAALRGAAMRAGVCGLMNLFSTSTTKYHRHLLLLFRFTTNCTSSFFRHTFPRQQPDATALPGLRILFLKIGIRQGQVDDPFDEGDDCRNECPAEHQIQNALHPAFQIELVGAESAQQQREQRRGNLVHGPDRAAVPMHLPGAALRAGGGAFMDVRAASPAVHVVGRQRRAASARQGAVRTGEQNGGCNVAPVLRLNRPAPGAMVRGNMEQVAAGEAELLVCLPRVGCAGATVGHTGISSLFAWNHRGTPAAGSAKARTSPRSCAAIAAFKPGSPSDAFLFQRALRHLFLRPSTVSREQAARIITSGSGTPLGDGGLYIFENYLYIWEADGGVFSRGASKKWDPAICNSICGAGWCVPISVISVQGSGHRKACQNAALPSG